MLLKQKQKQKIIFYHTIILNSLKLLTLINLTDLTPRVLSPFRGGDCVRQWPR